MTLTIEYEDPPAYEAEIGQARVTLKADGLAASVAVLTPITDVDLAEIRFVLDAKLQDLRARVAARRGAGEKEAVVTQ